MSNRSKSAPVPASFNAVTPGALSSAELDRRLADARSKLVDLLSRAEAVRQERELRKISDPNLTLETLDDFSRREAAAIEAIGHARELIEALSGQLYEARDAEWLAAKLKRKAELELLCTSADALYEKAHGLLTEAGKVVGQLKSIHLQVGAFVKTTDARVGYLEYPEHRIRHVKGGYSNPRPLWDELALVRAVYPGDGRIEVPVLTSFPIELPPPQAPAATPMPRPTSEVGDSGSLLLTVHGVKSPELPAAETGFLTRSLVRSADEAPAGDARRVSDSRPLGRGGARSPASDAAAGPLVQGVHPTAPPEQPAPRENFARVADDARTAVEQIARREE